MKSMQLSKMYCDQNKSVRFFKFCTQIVIPRQTEEKWKTCHVAPDTFHNVCANTGNRIESWERIQTNMVS